MRMVVQVLMLPVAGSDIVLLIRSSIGSGELWLLPPKVRTENDIGPLQSKFGNKIFEYDWLRISADWSWVISEPSTRQAVASFRLLSAEILPMRQNAT
jgi:hypothetical protein